LVSDWCLFGSFFFFSSRRRHTRFSRDWSSDVCSSDLEGRRQEVSTFSFVDVEPALTDVGGTVLAEPGVASSAVQRAAGIYLIVRSEERRIGKECGARWGENK